MCGIAGYLSYRRPASQAVAQVMCDQIRHRGPDDEGFFTSGPIAMGMRRLSIIDLAGGHQPMANEDESVWVIFNGEIYNYQALRQDLISRGHRFRTDSDTETLVHGYEEFGPAFVSNLRGMFAYAIWDGRAQSLFVARDRFGKKPLYYAKTPEGFFFASELKCLRAVGAPDELDAQALAFYLQFGYVPEPASAFQGVSKLPAGCSMTVEPHSGTEINPERYWSVPEPCEEERPGASEAEVCEEIRGIFDEAVRLRMIADVPLGAFLSGGIDSGLVVASMARQSSRPVKTFSIGFAEQAYNELPLARLVAAKYQTEHHELIVRPDAVDLVPRLIRQFDEPLADTSAIPTYLVSEFARRSVTVALSGDGGDEFFGGYTEFFEANRNRVFDRVPKPVRKLLAGVANALPYSSYGKNYFYMISRDTPVERFIQSASFSSHHLRRQALHPEWLMRNDEAFLSEYLGAAILDGAHDPVSQAMQYSAVAKLTGDILVKVDRMSMAVSLEVRCPLLDHVLAEAANRIPNAWKLRGRRGKLILRKALGDRLPPELLTAPKRGFGVPMNEWIRGPLNGLMRETLLSQRARERGIMRPAAIERMFAEHGSGRRDNSYFLYLLFVFEHWLMELGSNVQRPSPALH
jgi:asparagine synthase (glutamine-hydrolysing)